MACPNQSSVGSTGGIYMRRVHIPTACTVTNVLCAVVNTVGQNLANCYAALFDASGNRLAVSIDRSSLFTSAGLVTVPLSSPFSLVTAGDYYIGLLFNFSGSTPNVLPGLLRGTNVANSVCNMGLASGSSRVANGSNGNTTMPVSTTISAGNHGFWMGLS